MLMMRSRFIWSGINKDVRSWIRTCVKCQASKVTRHTTFTPVTERFHHVHVDIVGPLPYSNGFRYILTCVDKFTRWPAAAPLTNITTDTVAKAFIDTWISRFGVPLSLTSDRGSQFESSLWNKIMSLLGIKRYRTTTYHPQSNGLVEHFHRQLKSSLTATAENRADWTVTLPIVLLGIRTSVKEDIGYSSAELVYGTTLRLPGEFLSSTIDPKPCSVQDFTSSLKESMHKLQPVQPRKTSSKTFVSQELATCTHVFVRVDSVRKPLQPPYEGPFAVLKRTRKTMTINRNGSSYVVSIDRVKPAFLLHQSETATSISSYTNQQVPPGNASGRHKKTVSFLLPRH
ncbi:hypothetical protein Pcinc_001370 [Petrolisthes cinctipes]|uniref:Integrase catalytic domain-containing protein n=1 Tax=Petrolisthes cinctipes TaxID=88211 RepID=A0AAE1GNE8_PETCI|nr:hypothetical protein Pcinc_001370 [Petrolisthes cinctipes]